jgi:glycosyltransferase involved in cell wall biosynthesis
MGKGGKNALRKLQHLLGRRRQTIIGMKLNWFSPLPPARTGIADYTVGILRTLNKYAQITLWTDQRAWDRSIESLASVRRFESNRLNWPELHAGDVTFYNLGNNHLFHASVWEVSRQHSGVVVLHDLHVHSFFDSLYRGVWRDEVGYLAQMEAHYGQEGRLAATEFINSRLNIDVMAERYPLTSLAIENCLAVLVHTAAGFEKLKQDKRWAVAYAQLPAVFPPLSENGESTDVEARKLEPPYRLIVFGHLGRNRRLNEVFEALSRLQNRQLFRLDVYGEIQDIKALRLRVRSLHLTDIVNIHGYASEADLAKALDGAHLAINLRYPTMGEASASQLRIWSHALPSLVTKVGWYSSLSEDTVAHVRPDHEVEDILAHLKAFQENPARFAKMGRAGLKTLRNCHDPELYVRTILELANNADRLRLRVAANDLANRAGAKMGTWTTDPGSDSVRGVAQRIHNLINGPS